MQSISRLFFRMLIISLSAIIIRQPNAAVFTTFESGQVRPLAISPNRDRLFAVNTPDNRLEILSLKSLDLTLESSVQVGMEPVAVAVRTNGEVWIINHLSDSVSIVDVLASPARVVCTLPVGDEPQDIVFAGPDKKFAFVTTARRGQNSPHPVSDQLTPGIGRADVWVFDAARINGCTNVAPINIINLFSDKPRALAVSPDGNTIYAAAFHSGNRTTSINEGLVCDGGATAKPCTIEGGIVPGGLPAPNANIEGVPGPEVGLILKFKPELGQWQDELGRNWSDAIRFDLPDLDIFAINANPSSGVPEKIGGPLSGISGVGTILFNMVVNPASGVLYVSNTEAQNHVRFEGMGSLAAGQKPLTVPATVRGHLHEARITVVSSNAVAPRHLNKHIDYGAISVPVDVKRHSLATPLGMAVSGDGSKLYVAAFGSSKIGVFDTAQLETDRFDPTTASANYIALQGGGPTGIALDEPRNRLYVLTRFDNTISTVDLSSRKEIDRLSLFNPEPKTVVEGRRFLYDANLTSSNGEASCAACHVFGDTDDLAWDLGNPDDTVIANPNPFQNKRGSGPKNTVFHPIKGPMSTQSLRGLARHGPMHWRGDRTGGNDPSSGDPLDEMVAFKAFNAAFGGLLGRNEGPLSEEEMQAFTNFVLQITYPPNPLRQLDNSLRPEEQRGREIFFRSPVTDAQSCNKCHNNDPIAGRFGSSGLSRKAGQTQDFKIPHLRNLYQKVGMFGMADTPFILTGTDHRHTGPQVRGFGFLHDGSIDTLPRFLSAIVFEGFERFANPQRVREEVAAFLLVFDSNLAPIVGQQVTVTPDNFDAAKEKAAPLFDHANTSYQTPDEPSGNECDLIAKGFVGNRIRGWVWAPSQRLFTSDTGESNSASDLLALARADYQAITLTCTPPGSGRRMGIDHDLDGILDGQDAYPANSNRSANHQE